jgi:hypothetical protein
MVMREHAIMSASLKENASTAMVYEHLAKVECAPGNEPISWNFIDVSLTSSTKIMNDPVIISILEHQDAIYNKAGPLTQITKWQTIINRCKSDPAKIRWCFQHFHDSLRMSFMDAGDLSVSKLNSKLCETAILKREVLWPKIFAEWSNPQLLPTRGPVLAVNGLSEKSEAKQIPCQDGQGWRYLAGQVPTRGWHGRRRPQAASGGAEEPRGRARIPYALPG